MILFRMIKSPDKDIITQEAFANNIEVLKIARETEVSIQKAFLEIEKISQSGFWYFQESLFQISDWLYFRQWSERWPQGPDDNIDDNIYSIIIILIENKLWKSTVRITHYWGGPDILFGQSVSKSSQTQLGLFLANLRKHTFNQKSLNKWT